MSGIPQLSLEPVQPGTSSPPTITTTTSSPIHPTVSPAISTGSKREPSDSDCSKSSPFKRNKSTEWRKEQNKEIEQNYQLLKNYKEEVADKEMFILIHQAILEGLRCQKTFDYQSMRTLFEEPKRYTAGLLQTYRHWSQLIRLRRRVDARRLKESF